MADDRKKDEIMFDMLQQAVDKIDGVKNDVSCIDKKLDLHVQKMEYEIKRINELDETQNTLLDQHIAGVNTLRDMHELNKKEVNARLERLEEPHKVFKGLVRLVIALGAVSGALAGILKFLGVLG